MNKDEGDELCAVIQRPGLPCHSRLSPNRGVGVAGIPGEPARDGGGHGACHPRSHGRHHGPVQAWSEGGDFHGALELCEMAIALDLGDLQAKRDSLDWAR